MKRAGFLRINAHKATLDAKALRRCPMCKIKFQPDKASQTVCSPECAEKHVTAQNEKAARIEAKRIRASDRERKQKLKTISEWEKDAEAEVNRYVRLRDAHLGCVSCDKPASWPGQWHASHFRSVGAASAVRFHLWNIHKACSQCNKWKSGNLSEYEPRLIAKIGKEKVDWLRTQNQITRRSVEYLKRLKKVFLRKANRLQKRLQ